MSAINTVASRVRGQIAKGDVEDPVGVDARSRHRPCPGRAAQHPAHPPAATAAAAALRSRVPPGMEVIGRGSVNAVDAGIGAEMRRLAPTRELL